MDIREAILAEHSSHQTAKIVRYVGSDAGRFAELMGLFTGTDRRVMQRSSWAAGNCVESHPELADPYYALLFRMLERTDTHIAVKRNVVRLMQFVNVPSRHRGRVFDVCCSLVGDPTEPVAVRSFALSAAARIARDLPDLMAELRLAATRYPEADTPGFKARRRKVLGV